MFKSFSKYRINGVGLQSIFINGIAAVDSESHIAYNNTETGKNLPVMMGLNKSVSSLDQTVLRDFVVSNSKDRKICFVIGEHTLKELKHSKILKTIQKLSPNSYFIASNSHEALIYEPPIFGKHPTKIRYTPDEASNTLDELRYITYKFCIENSIETVLVLGGASVYKAFEDFYDEFCVVQAKVKVPNSFKKIELDFLNDGFLSNYVYEDSTLSINHYIKEQN